MNNEHDDDTEGGKFSEAGPRLDRNRSHIRRCHSRWVKQMTRPSGPNDPESWVSQQCGGCRFYIHQTGGFRSDWGVCTNMSSPRDGQATFEHDGCDQFAPCEAGWS